MIEDDRVPCSWPVRTEQSGSRMQVFVLSPLRWVHGREGAQALDKEKGTESSNEIRFTLRVSFWNCSRFHSETVPNLEDIIYTSDSPIITYNSARGGWCDVSARLWVNGEGCVVGLVRVIEELSSFFLGGFLAPFIGEEFRCCVPSIFVPLDRKVSVLVPSQWGFFEALRRKSDRG